VNQFLSIALQGCGPSSIQWFPDYGCAVVFHTCSGQRSNYLSIDIIGLDNHQLEIRPGASAYEFSSVARSYCRLHVGELSSENKQTFEEKLGALLKKAKQRKEDERSAASGKQGHQKTPAFLRALSIQALRCIACASQCVCEDILPNGGLTDVGRHTGGMPRDTHYALVKSVCQWILDRDLSSQSSLPASFDTLMLHFHCFVLENTMTLIKEIDAGGVSATMDKRVEYLWIILKGMAPLAAKLSDDGHDLNKIYEKMIRFKITINLSRGKWHQNHEIKNKVELTNGPYRTPKAIIPDFTPAQFSDELTAEKVGKLIEENLGMVSLLPDLEMVSLLPDKCVRKAAEWAIKVKQDYFRSTDKLFTFLRQIEKVFWSISDNYLHETAMELEELDPMVTLLDLYREALNVAVKVKSVEHLVNRMRSIEVILVWVGYCATFNAVKHKHYYIMNGFGVALHVSDLRHLVLQDRQHIEVMQRVALFLDRHSVTNMEVFSTRESQDWGSPTFLLGGEFSRIYLNDVLQREKSDAAERVAKHWTEVKGKQARARKLRQELRVLEIKLEKANATCDKMECIHGYNDRISISARDSRDNRSRRVNSKKNEITQAEEAPSAVVQPLPRSKNKAFKVLFFLYMNEEFQHLSRLSFLAQQLLVPTPWVSPCGGADGVDQVDVHKSIAVRTEVIPWDSHYNAHQKCCYHSTRENRRGTAQLVSISMHDSIPAPSTIGPCHVDHFTSQEDGIWYPDKSGIRMMWYGGSPQDKHTLPFNPFAIENQFTGMNHDSAYEFYKYSQSLMST
jgi:hypothetical protein